MPSSILAEPSPISAGGKAVPRVVIIFIESEECTVRIALPAYMGRTKAVV